MGSREGGWLGPEAVALLRSALDEAWATLTEDQRAGASRADMALRVFKLAQKGVRDPVRLRTCALIDIARPPRVFH